MISSYITYILKSRRNVLLALMCVACIIGYVFQNDIPEYPVSAFFTAHGSLFFLTFPFFVLLCQRVSFYINTRKLSSIRIGEAVWYREVWMIELSIWVSYLFIVFYGLPVMLGARNDPTLYVFLIPWTIAWCTSYFIMMYFLGTPGKELWGIYISLIIILICHYAILQYINIVLKSTY